MGRNIVIVDDDVQASLLLQVMLQVLGCNSIVFNRAHDFLLHTLNEDDVVLLDLVMPELDGIEVLRRLAKLNCRSKLILLSGYDKSILHSAEKLGRAHELRVIASLSKPFQMRDLQRVLSFGEQSIDSEQAGKAEVFPLFTADQLRFALFNQQIELHYQPQIDLSDGSLIGVEALARWNHPDFGLLMPAQFIGLAEQSELMIAFTTEVVKQAIDQSRSWSAESFNPRMSVNISADNIISLALPEQLNQVLISKEMAGMNLMLEVTESTLMGELLTSLDTLTRLRMKGFGLSIDDFGTGYSSLSQLHRVPFCELKIDQSFVQTMEYDADSKAIVKTCIRLGHELGMEVVAEGVENEIVLSILSDLNCDVAQGYLFAKAMPADELLKWSMLGYSESLIAQHCAA
ncbi:MAG: EAL domain-containing response regulator [Pseudomonadales bacterium]|nr:EAL domain-containing response regulator [Pseudomonadales bacterium]